MISKKISNLELDIATEGKFCFDDIQVSISDADKQALTRENIREGVTILGVTGLAKDGSSVNDTYNIPIDTLMEESVVFNKTDSVKYKKVVIPKLDVTSEPNLKSKYIKSNVSILGVTGSLVVNEDNIKDNAKEYKDDSEAELFDIEGYGRSTRPREFNAPSGYTCFKNLRFKNLNIDRYNLKYGNDLFYLQYGSDGSEVSTKLATGIYYGNIVGRPSQNAQGNTTGSTEDTNYINTDIYGIPINLSESEIKYFIKEFSTGNTLFRCENDEGIFKSSRFYLYVPNGVAGYNLFEYKS